jgi:hypothetical protein
MSEKITWSLNVQVADGLHRANQLLLGSLSAGMLRPRSATDI